MRKTLAMASTHSKFVSLSAAALLVLIAVPACSKEEKAQKAAPASASKTSGEATTVESPTTTPAAGKPETVVFEVTGTGSATTIDLVPSGPERLYNVPLPWSSTITITSDVNQLQVVVVGGGDTPPGCKITLDGNVVAEQPEGGSAHCVFDR
jgi:Mycobacterium membrane protein